MPADLTDLTDLNALADRLVRVPGIVGVSLGGSRARGEHTADSDVDLGLYYRAPLDLVALQTLADEIADVPAGLVAPGGWGPWVDGGGWLRVDGTPVDFLYRDVDRVARSCSDAVQGRFEWHFQVGHPLGFPGTTYAGELAHGVLLADPTGELTALRRNVEEFPPALREAVVDRLDEARFLLGGAAKAVPRGDSAYVAGCLFRVLLLCAHALHADAGRFVLNEKGAVTAAGRLDGAPEGFAERVHGLLAAPGRDPAALGAALRRAGEVLDETREALARSASGDGAQGEG